MSGWKASGVVGVGGFKGFQGSVSFPGLGAQGEGSRQ